MKTFRTRIGAGGRIVIPAHIREALNFNPGDEVVLALSDGELRIFSINQAVHRAQAMVRRYVPEGKSLVQELIQERRKEGALE